MTQIIKTKQTVEIKVSFLFDEISQQEEYDRAIEEDNHAFAEKLNNQDTIMLIVNVDANVKMPCGHYENVFDSLGGCDWDTNQDITKIVAFTYYKMVENVKDQVIEIIGDNVDFVVSYDKNVEYD